MAAAVVRVSGVKQGPLSGNWHGSMYNAKNADVLGRRSSGTWSLHSLASSKAYMDAHFVFRGRELEPLLDDRDVLAL